MLPDHLKNKHFFVVSTNYLLCFNDYGGKKKYLHAGLLWSANLGKDGFSKEGTQTGTSPAPEQHSSANQHLNPELQLGTIFDPR